LKLTRYEKARIIGARALQLSMGAPTLIKISGDFAEPLSIAIKELEAGVIPITVRRNMPVKKETGEAAVPGKK
jgi:DNA-directed RNA polymerase subunit K